MSKGDTLGRWMIDHPYCGLVILAVMLVAELSIWGGVAYMAGVAFALLFLQ